jgi:peptide-methionine (S)-S-oxide reductase
VNAPPGRPGDDDGVPEIRPARMDGVLNSATLAGGCFWCLEAVYLQLKGVVGAKSGYAGGRRPNPTYEQVCSGATGHAEVVQVTYDPGQISYGDLLDVFFTIHDPTTLNRQGADSGTQYRSAIFFGTPDQERKARAKIAALEAEHVWDDPIVTEVVPLTEFWPAENYHDDYFARNPRNPYCAAVIAPKVAKARKHFFEKLAK